MNRKNRKNLSELIAQCDPQAPMPEDTKAWEESAPVGKEAPRAGVFDSAWGTTGTSQHAAHDRGRGIPQVDCKVFVVNPTNKAVPTAFNKKSPC
jgi:hypothetical protein